MTEIHCPACGLELSVDVDVELAVVGAAMPTAEQLTIHGVRRRTARANGDIDVDGIFKRVSFRTGIPVAHLRGSSRIPRIAKARQRVMWELHEAGLSTKQIGRVLSRDHTTVSHGIRAHEAREVLA